MDRTAKGYFVDFVLPDYRDALEKPLSIRHAYHSAISLNGFADHYVYRNMEEPNATKVARFREKLHQENPAVQWVNVMANAYKHVKAKPRYFTTIVAYCSAGSMENVSFISDNMEDLVATRSYEAFDRNAMQVGKLFRLTKLPEWPEAQLSFSTRDGHAVVVLNVLYAALETIGRYAEASDLLSNEDNPWFAQERWGQSRAE